MKTHYDVLLTNLLAIPFRLKRDLVLVNFGSGNNSNPVTKLDDNLELILMIANYDPECGKLAKALDHIEGVNGVDVRIASSNFLGYGLFNECIYGIPEFKARFSRQIYCK
ncbi:hypothetical protein KP002_19430 [Geomonas subterranea]|uniref:hypothetical protein n=1 Tax=Geomonas subterranea TaxID=2847989 RepID=UPI001C46B9C5|nr:hypothetical protein [Geomonas subterranea]QXM09105.1 hypothetical protein KP002_19430 [Geomonas subterranea]